MMRENSQTRLESSASDKWESPWPTLSTQWRHNLPPLRPSNQDLGFCWHSAQEWIGERGTPRVLLLGVTPELYSLPWPKKTDFLAVDRTQSMIDLSWQGPREAVRCADWRSLALLDGSRDIVLGDGVLHLLNYPQEQKMFIGLLRRVLSDRGRCILRLFTPPVRRESPHSVLSDLLDGKIHNVSALKLRMAMALQNSVREGVALGEIFRTIHDAVPDLAGLAERIGWPLEQMLAIKAFEGSPFRYFYSTPEEAACLFCRNPGVFRQKRLQTPSYELGQCCPTATFEKSPGN